MNRRTFLTSTGAVAILSASGKVRAEASDRLKVLIPKMTPEQLDALRAVAPEVELVVCGDGREALERAAEADASYGFISAELLRAGKKLRWVQQGSAGVESIVGLPEMARGDLVLTNMQRIYAPEIADQAMGYLLAFTRHLDHDIRTRGDERWRSRRPEMVFEELEGKTMLIVGLGGIGSHIARRARGSGCTSWRPIPR